MESTYFQLRSAIIFLLQVYLIASLFPTAAPCPDYNKTTLSLPSYIPGSDVVIAVISELHSLQIIECDHGLLRRIALVETNDGLTWNSYYGGIWALDESKFHIVAKKAAEVLNSSYCIGDANDIAYYYLMQPLISGLAASLYLNYLVNTLNASIPLAENIEEQAQFWISYYHSGGLTVDYFIKQVKRRESKSKNKMPMYMTLYYVLTVSVFLYSGNCTLNIIS